MGHNKMSHSKLFLVFLILSGCALDCHNSSSVVLAARYSRRTGHDVQVNKTKFSEALQDACVAAYFPQPIKAELQREVTMVNWHDLSDDMLCKVFVSEPVLVNETNGQFKVAISYSLAVAEWSVSQIEKLCTPPRKSSGSGNESFCQVTSGESARRTWRCIHPVESIWIQNNSGVYPIPNGTFVTVNASETTKCEDISEGGLPDVANGYGWKSLLLDLCNTTGKEKFVAAGTFIGGEVGSLLKYALPGIGLFFISFVLLSWRRVADCLCKTSARKDTGEAQHIARSVLDQRKDRYCFNIDGHDVCLHPRLFCDKASKFFKACQPLTDYLEFLIDPVLNLVTSHQYDAILEERNTRGDTSGMFLLHQFIKEDGKEKKLVRCIRNHRQTFDGSWNAEDSSMYSWKSGESFQWITPDITTTIQRGSAYLTGNGEAGTNPLDGASQSTVFLNLGAEEDLSGLTATCTTHIQCPTSLKNICQRMISQLELLLEEGIINAIQCVYLVDMTRASHSNEDDQWRALLAILFETGRLDKLCSAYQQLNDGD